MFFSNETTCLLQHVICSTIHEDLCGGESAIKAIKEELADGHRAKPKGKGTGRHSIASTSMNLPVRTEGTATGAHALSASLGPRAVSAMELQEVALSSLS